MDKPTLRPEEIVREKLGKYLKQMVFWFIVFAVLFLLAGIWHALVSMQMQDEMFFTIAGKNPYIISVILSVLSFASLVMFIVLAFFLYSCGTIYCLHFTLAGIIVLTVLSYITLICYNIYNTQPKTQHKYEDTLRKMINLPIDQRDNVTNNWMLHFGCTNLTDCEPYIERSVSLQCNGEFIACCVILVISFFSIIGFVVAVCCMGCIPRPDDNISLNQMDPTPLVDSY